MTRGVILTILLAGIVLPQQGYLTAQTATKPMVAAAVPADGLSHAPQCFRCETRDFPDAPVPACQAQSQTETLVQTAAGSTTASGPRKPEYPAPGEPAAAAGIPGARAKCRPGSSSIADGFMCCGSSTTSLYSRFLDASPPLPLTPRQKLLLAWNDVEDPFNLLTIAAEAAFTIGANPHTSYGPGMPGFAKYAGVSLTQDATGEFFGTFLIPSLAHQDPRYRRMPNSSLRRRLAHVLDAVVVGQSDDGRPMFNYANVLGSIATNSLGNVYVPGRKKGVGATAARISINLATDPIGNSIAEFLPDLARRININVVLVQRVINRVAIAQGAGPMQ